MLISGQPALVRFVFNCLYRALKNVYKIVDKRPVIVDKWLTQ